MITKCLCLRNMLRALVLVHVTHTKMLQGSGSRIKVLLWKGQWRVTAFSYWSVTSNWLFGDLNWRLFIWKYFFNFLLLSIMFSLVWCFACVPDCFQLMYWGTLTKCCHFLFSCWVEKPCYRWESLLVIDGTWTQILAGSRDIAALNPQC